MSTRQRRQSKLKPLLVPALSLLVLGYFAYHAVEGSYGLYALEKLQAREAELTAALGEVRAQRAEAEHQIALMRPESLDSDLVDERARQALNVARPRDLVILLDPRSGAESQ
ncbi:FtsB family cell division protein [Propylenella binzhouense]|uniref:Septum formation initiator family protein n=1 Tax=Propylenella binzhouense TaxID=2555902 RepID=A0A964T7Q5_9HYPH|nr:septum formation initiator family protein [Propylenella binzhouense]MYZ50096.1 septum formation initiator family protein [Propylenella binzhouense]